MWPYEHHENIERKDGNRNKDGKEYKRVEKKTR